MHAVKGSKIEVPFLSLAVCPRSVVSFISTFKLRYEQLDIGILRLCGVSQDGFMQNLWLMVTVSGTLAAMIQASKGLTVC